MRDYFNGGIFSGMCHLLVEGWDGSLWLCPPFVPECPQTQLLGVNGGNGGYEWGLWGIGLIGGFDEQGRTGQVIEYSFGAFMHPFKAA